MATPGETRDQLIRDLRAARSDLMSADWLTMIRVAPKAQRREAAENLMKVQLALLDLENEALAAFRDDLVANEAAITSSTASMKTALAKLETVTKVLKAVTGFLEVVARVVKLF
jgi:hypothetical protein